MSAEELLLLVSVADTSEETAVLALDDISLEMENDDDISSAEVEEDNVKLDENFVVNTVPDGEEVASVDKETKPGPIADRSDAVALSSVVKTPVGVWLVAVNERRSLVDL